MFRVKSRKVTESEYDNSLVISTDGMVPDSSPKALDLDKVSNDAFDDLTSKDLSFVGDFYSAHLHKFNPREILWGKSCDSVKMPCCDNIKTLKSKGYIEYELSTTPPYAEIFLTERGFALAYSNIGMNAVKKSEQAHLSEQEQADEKKEEKRRRDENRKYVRGLLERLVGNPSFISGLWVVVFTPATFMIGHFSDAELLQVIVPAIVFVAGFTLGYGAGKKVNSKL